MPLPLPYWADMTALDFSTDTDDWIAVIPTAAIEQHGPHLPLGTDTIIAEGMVKTVVERLPDDIPASFLPVQAIGKSNEHISYRGTLTMAWETAIKAWLEIATSVARAGVRRIVFANSHGGNTAMLDIVTRELRVRFDMLAVHSAWMRFGEGEAIGEAERAYGIHGGQVETALIQHFRPDLVRTEHLQDFASEQARLVAERSHLRAHGQHVFAWKAGDLNPNGVVGDAAAATPALGARIAAHQADRFIELLRDVATIDLSVLK
ncbi:creatininase family protein [Acuticoccus sp. M5D2P5]|uniref:creatininase family protein n=1 Tax=Acuticoccus kalidii TaxID=2910977 RepID=UPI001F2894B0|nr:creatininase family protein [Acuticoccus kalidii]MCF3934177.1 creatininase family protein [Acuticoccus kalidii]